jgi:hypothetical protein
LALVLLVGCGSKASVSGRVLYRNKPLPGGWVTFRLVNSSAPAVSAPLDEEGHYEVTLPPGEVEITVDNRELQPPPPDRGPAGPALPSGVKLPPGVKPPETKPPPPTQEPPSDKPAGAYVPIPPKYYEFDTSGLRYTVKPGAQTHDIELE